MNKVPLGRGPGRLCYGEDVDGFEQVAFALAVVALNKDHARLELQIQAAVVAEVDEVEVGQVDGTASRTGLAQRRVDCSMGTWRDTGLVISPQSLRRAQRQR